MSRGPVQPGIRPLGRVIPAEEAGLYLDAAGALAQARKQARQLMDAAASDAAAARGRAVASARTEAEAETARRLAEAALRNARELTALRPLLADAIADGVARILGARPAADVAAEAAAHAVASLQDRMGVTVRVPPAGTEAVTAALGAMGNEVRVLADATLGADECVIETAGGFVRAGVSAQLGRLREALRAASAEGEAA